MRSFQKISLEHGRINQESASREAHWYKWRTRHQALPNHLQACHPGRTEPDPDCAGCRELVERIAEEARQGSPKQG